MTKFLTSAVVTMAALLSCPNQANSQIYLDELNGYTYLRMIDNATDETEYYSFSDDDGDGVLTGVKSHTKIDPNDPAGRVSVDDDQLERYFVVVESESCGNCMTFEFDDEGIEYFFQDHDMGTFWIQRTDKLFKKFDDKLIFSRQMGMGDMGDDADMSGEGEGGYEGDYQDAEELPVIIAVSAQTERYFDWGDKPEQGWGWVLDYEQSSFAANEVSSTLPEEDGFQYSSSNLFDDDPTTAWFSDPDNSGDSYPLGEFVSFSGYLGADESIWILNGLQSSGEEFDENSRVKSMSIYIDGVRYADIELLDQMGAQELILTGIKQYQSEDGSIDLKFTINEIYPGTEFKEAGISEIFTLVGGN